MREIQPHEVLDAARLSPKRNPAKVSGQGGVFSTQGPKKLEPISKLPTAVDRIKMSNDSAQGRAVGAHPGSFSGGPQLDDSQKRRVAESDVDPVNAASERSTTSADLVFPPASSMYRPSRCHRPSVDDS
jgi:hypothetical protein